MELLLVFVVLWYIVDWTLVTARVYHAPMGFDTEHCYNIAVGKLGRILLFIIRSLLLMMIWKTCSGLRTGCVIAPA